MNNPTDEYVISSFIAKHTTDTCSAAELNYWVEFYERTRNKELIKEDKIKSHLNASPEITPLIQV